MLFLSLICSLFSLNSRALQPMMSKQSCFCLLPASRFTVRKAGQNFGRKFYRCNLNVCKYFKWDDNLSVAPSHAVKITRQLTSKAVDIDEAMKTAAYVVFSDGACKGNSDVKHNVCAAGWGAAILKHCDSNDGFSIVSEIWGPVVLDAADPAYLGAEVTSNNSAELSAIGEALKWLRDVDKTKAYPIIFRYDSEYAAKSITGEFNGPKNKLLIHNIRQLYREVVQQRDDGGNLKSSEIIQFHHVKGHSENMWNDLADQLANRGALMSSINRPKSSDCGVLPIVRQSDDSVVNTESSPSMDDSSLKKKRKL